MSPNLARDLLILVFLLVGASGCGKSPLPPMSDPEAARAALQAALDAWKAGSPSGVLTSRSPPLYFNEPRYQDKLQLLDFAIQEGHEQYGQSVRLMVSVKMKNRDGKVVERTLPYLVDTAPAVVIVPG